MPLATGATVGIAVSAAFASFMLTATLFLLLRRHEELIRANKEAEMAPIVRDKWSNHYRIRSLWMKEFMEHTLVKSDGTGTDQFYTQWIIDYVVSTSPDQIFHQFGIPFGATPATLGPTIGNKNDQAPYDISAAISRYFDGQIELGIDHRVIARLLFHENEFERKTGMEFLINKAALSFFNFGSNPKYSILPPKIMALAEELKVRGPISHDNYQDRNYNLDHPNPFEQFFHRWRMLTFAMYGSTDMPPEVHASKKRRVDFLMTVLGPVLKPETLDGAQERMEEIMNASHDLALHCADQLAVTVTSWDYTDQTNYKVTYTGEPQEIPPFDMMAQKTLVVRPAFLFVASEVTGIPFVRPYAREPAKLVKFTDAEWEELTKDL